MFDITTDNNHYCCAQNLLSAYKALANAEIGFAHFIAMIDTLATEEDIQREDLCDRLDAIVPSEELPQFEWLLSMLTGSDRYEHRWYWDQRTGRLRLHGAHGE